MSFQIKIVVVHRRDKLLLEMTEEYMIYHGKKTLLSLTLVRRCEMTYEV